MIFELFIKLIYFLIRLFSNQKYFTNIKIYGDFYMIIINFINVFYIKYKKRFILILVLYQIKTKIQKEKYIKFHFLTIQIY